MAEQNVIEIVLKAVDSLSADLKNVEANLKNVQGRLDDVAKTGGTTGGSFDKFSAAIITVNQGLEIFERVASAAKATLGSYITEAAASETASNRLAVTLRTFGRSFPIDEIKRFASEVQDLTGIQDEAVLAVVSLLASMTDLDEQGLKSATQGVIGLSTALGKDFQSTAIQAALVFQGVTNRIRQSPIIVSEDLKGQERQVELLKQLGQFSQLASRDANTYAGAQRRLNAQLSEMKEAIGGPLLPLLVEHTRRLAELARATAAWAQAHPELIAQITGLIAIIGSTAGLIGALKLLSIALGAITLSPAGLAGLVVATTGAIVGLGLLNDKIRELAEGPITTARNKVDELKDALSAAEKLGDINAAQAIKSKIEEAEKALQLLVDARQKLIEAGNEIPLGNIPKSFDDATKKSTDALKQFTKSIEDQIIQLIAQQKALDESVEASIRYATEEKFKQFIQENGKGLSKVQVEALQKLKERLIDATLATQRLTQQEQARQELLKSRAEAVQKFEDIDLPDITASSGQRVLDLRKKANDDNKSAIDEQIIRQQTAIKLAQIQVELAQDLFSVIGDQQAYDNLLGKLRDLDTANRGLLELQIELQRVEVERLEFSDKATDAERNLAKVRLDAMRAELAMFQSETDKFLKNMRKQTRDAADSIARDFTDKFVDFLSNANTKGGFKKFFDDMAISFGKTIFTSLMQAGLSNILQQFGLISTAVAQKGGGASLSDLLVDVLKQAFSNTGLTDIFKSMFGDTKTQFSQLLSDIDKKLAEAGISVANTELLSAGSALTASGATLSSAGLQLETAATMLMQAAESLRACGCGGGGGGGGKPDSGFGELPIIDKTETDTGRFMPPEPIITETDITGQPSIFTDAVLDIADSFDELSFDMGDFSDSLGDATGGLSDFFRGLSGIFDEFSFGGIADWFSSFFGKGGLVYAGRGMVVANQAQSPYAVMGGRGMRGMHAIVGEEGDELVARMKPGKASAEQDNAPIEQTIIIQDNRSRGLTKADMVITIGDDVMRDGPIARSFKNVIKRNK